MYGLYIVTNQLWTLCQKLDDISASPMRSRRLISNCFWSLFMLGLKLIHVSISGPDRLSIKCNLEKVSINYTKHNIYMMVGLTSIT